MSFSVYIILTNVGSQAGPFDLYSDVDNYAVPLYTNVPKSALTQYYAATVPDGTEIIRVKSLGDCVNFIDLSINNLPTPSVTPTNTPTVTPTCPVTTQYLEATLQSCKAFKLAVWNDAGFTSAANANCNYIISGTAYGDLGTVYTGQETILSGQHQHNFNLNPVLLPGECVSGFTVHSYTLSGCACPVNLILPTPSVTPTSTPTMTPTMTLTPSVSPTQGLTPTPSVTPSITPTLTVTPTLTTTPSSTPASGGQLSVYGRYINSSQEFGYSVNGGPYLAIGEPISSTCSFFQTISGLQNGDTVVFTTLLTCSINGDSADCPNSTTSCSYTHNFVGTTSVYITVDATNCC